MNLKNAIARTTSIFAMKTQHLAMQSAAGPRRRRCGRFVPFIAFAFLALPSRAHASMFHGETLDSIADVIAWFAFIIVTHVLIGVFLLFTFLPQKLSFM